MRTAWVVLIATVGFGQGAIPRTETVSNPRTGQFTSRTTFTAGPAVTMRVVEEQPYSAEELFEHTQTLGDGTRIFTSYLHTRMYRDSTGRTRTERVIGPPERTDPPMMVEIYDPVAGSRYVLDPDKQTAHRSVLPPQPQTKDRRVNLPATPILPGGFGTNNLRPEYTSESLGTKELDGVMCEGRLNKTTYPAGAMGNDRPIVATSEVWYSQDLKLVVLSKDFDPRTGENVRRLAKLSRSQPEYSLFQPPSNYTIVDETGPFAVTITRPGTQQ